MKKISDKILIIITCLTIIFVNLIPSYASGGIKYVEELKLCYADSYDEAKEILGEAFVVVNQNITEGISPNEGVFLGYTITSDREKAITDIKIIEGSEEIKEIDGIPYQVVFDNNSSPASIYGTVSEKVVGIYTTKDISKGNPIVAGSPVFGPEDEKPTNTNRSVSFFEKQLVLYFQDYDSQEGLIGSIFSSNSSIVLIICPIVIILVIGSALILKKRKNLK